MTDFIRGLGHALGHRHGRILGAADQALAQFLRRRRKNEDADEIVLHRLGQLLGALPVDVEQHVAASLQRRRHRPLRRAVEIAEHLGVFEKLAPVAQTGEFPGADEVIILAVDLSRPRRPRGDGNRHLDMAVGGKEAPRQRRLSSTRWRRHDQQQAAALNVDHAFTRCSGPARASGR